jgi:hypothetical protein
VLAQYVGLLREQLKRQGVELPPELDEEPGEAAEPVGTGRPGDRR